MRFVFLSAFLVLAACDDYEPRSKKAIYDPSTHALVLPYPCPDWSRSSSVNYGNVPHSNYGCAVENNLAIQLENPKDLWRGNGSASPDAEIGIRTIQQYRAGTIPAPLTPMQGGATGE